MIPHILLSLVLASPPPATFNTEMVQTLDLGKMTWAEAKRLEGKFVRVSYTADFGVECNGFVRIMANGKPGIVRSVRYIRSVGWPQLNLRQKLTADGILWVRHSPARVLDDGEKIDEVRQIGITDAQSVRP